MPSRHTFETDADAPFDRLSVDFDFYPGTPATGPSWAYAGDPGEPASVEVIRCKAEIDGVWHELPAYFEPAILKMVEDELLEMGREYHAEALVYRRSRAA